MRNETLTVKRVPFYLFLILVGVGIAIGYFLFQRKDYSFLTNLNRSDWIQLPENEATDLMDRYKKEQAGIMLSSYRLRTSTDKILEGFWIDKKMIDSINNIVARESPNALINGYNVFFGKYDKAKRRHYALVVRATADPNPADATVDTLGIGKYFDMVDPCPDHCGGR